MTAGAAYRHVYLHVPFCRRRCSYCDFSIAVRRSVPVQAFNDAIMAELATRGERVDWDAFRSLYLGGGTPSLLGTDGVSQLIAGFRHRADVEGSSTSLVDAEVTLEANPEDVNPASAEAWRRAGVNRVSLGVQTFDEGALHWMHRGHGPAGARSAVEDLRRAGFENISIDLIFALPAALGRDWRGDLEAALELRPEHLSVYGLTIEPHTPLGRWTSRGTAVEAPEESYETEFLLAHELLTQAGYRHYEVSNYGLPGKESVHNSAYWSGASYLGLGPSAHGFDGSRRRWNIAAYAEWQGVVESGRDPIEGEEGIGIAERLAEEVYLGLRTQGGLRIHQDELEMVTIWVAQGWASLDADVVRLTATGWLRLDALATALTSRRSRS